jgi:hypothetical protein
LNSSSALIEFKCLLLQRGFSKIKVQIWVEFVHQVLQIYWQAADQLIEPTNWALFMKKRGAMGKPKRSRATVVVRVPMEDAITTEIGERADEIFIKLPAEHFLRKQSVKLTYEKLVPSKNRVGRYSKKTDFHAVSQFSNAPEIAIEAKPIKAVSDIKSQYFGSAGVGCFLTADAPYTTGPLAAMLAYTINSNGSRMQEQILTALQSYKPAPTQIHRTHLPCTGPVDCSSHDRAQWKLNPITILHLERIFPQDVQLSD